MSEKNDSISTSTRRPTGVEPFLALYEGVEADSRAASTEAPSWMHPFRRAAFARFHDLGLPTKRDEDWKYTDASALGKQEFGFPTAKSTIDLDRVRSYLPDGIEHFAVLIDGRFDTELSALDGANGVRLASTREALRTNPDAWQDWFGARSPASDTAMAALNGALFQDGWTLEVDANTEASPIAIVHHSTASEGTVPFVPTRNLVRVGAGAKAAVVELFVGDGEGDVLEHAVVDVETGENARLDHYILEQTVRTSHLYAAARAKLAAGSRYGHHLFTYRADWVRSEVRAELLGQGSHCDLNGLYVGHGQRHVDCHTTLDHAVPNSTSWEVYRGVMDDNSSASFLGKINVFPDAQKTDAKQSSSNLLLSPKAVANSRPCLEIYADDVKCTHGATIGQIEESALFYLRSRGIPAEKARRMLVHAFAAELVEAIELGSVRETVAAALDEILAGGIESA